MSDTAPPSLPPTPPRSSAPGESAAPLRPGEQALKILATDAELQALRQAVRLEGVVRKITRDGAAAIIETDQGEVEVQLRPRTVLEVGQKVQIDLPPGHPPRQLVLRPAPDTNATPGTTPPPRTEQAQGPDPSTPRPATPGSPPVEQSVTPPRMTAQPSLPPVMREMLDTLAPVPGLSSQRPTPLKPDAIIRLVPLAALPELLPQPTDILTARLPAALPVSGASVQLPHNAVPTITELSLPNTALTTSTHNLPTPPPPAVTGQIFPPALSPDQPALQGRMDVSGDPKAIRLPLQQQIFPFIIPVSAHAVPMPSGPVDMRVMAIIPPDIMAPAMASPAAITPFTITTGDHASPLTIKGDVIAMTQQHFPVLSLLWPGHDTPDSFLLQFPASNLPVGTQVELQPYSHAAMAPSTPAAASLLPTPAAVLMQGWDWPVFDEAVQVLSAAQMPLAQALTQMIPNPATPAQIPPAIVFFMAAIGAGDLSSWLGDKAVNALRREGAKGADILSRLSRDFSGLSRMADDPVPSQDWKAMVIPMMGQEDISKIHLFTRQQDPEQEDQDDSQDGRSTRFLFDFHLTRIGDVQLDGYMKAKRLDLIVRTKTLFSPTMQNQMRNLYQGVLEQGQLSGDLGFQNRADQWVRVDMRQSAVKTSV